MTPRRRDIAGETANRLISYCYELNVIARCLCEVYAGNGWADVMNVQDIYNGSDGEATKALYALLATHGPIGELATNLLRAQKSSERAKVYRGVGYRGMAYEKKGWSITNLVAILAKHGAALSIVYGWQLDEATGGYPWVVYCDLPTGQVSFHMAGRGDGPDYAGTWDGIKGVSADRIVRWCQSIVNGQAPSGFATTQDQVDETKPAPQKLWCRACAAWWANRRTCPVHVSIRLEPKVMPVPLPELRPGSARRDDMSKGKYGFASMSPERQREIASLGGKAARAKGTSHSWSSEEARIAGRKGGLRTGERRRRIEMARTATRAGR